MKTTDGEVDSFTFLSDAPLVWLSKSQSSMPLYSPLSLDMTE